MLKSQERGNLARNRLGDSLVTIDFRASHFVNGSLQPQIMTKTRLSSSQKRFSQLPGKQMLLADESHNKGKYGLIAELKVLFSRQCLPSKSCAAVHLATVTVESDCGCKICHENLQKCHFKIKNKWLWSELTQQFLIPQVHRSLVAEAVAILRPKTVRSAPHLVWSGRITSSEPWFVGIFPI